MTKQEKATKERERYRKNSEKIRARTKAYYYANHERSLEIAKEYRESHSEQIKRHYSDNREKYCEYSRKWRQENPEYWALLQHNRRARMIGNGGSYTLKQKREKFDELGNRCFYCGSKDNITVDHQTPVARGGTNNIDNIVPCCIDCNRRKNARTQDEFFPHFQPDGTPTPGIMVKR